MSYSNAWREQARYKPPAVASPRLVDHRHPSDHDTGRNWQNAPQNPAVPPLEVVDNQALTLDSAPGGYPWDPPGHAQGVGYGAGLAFASSVAQNDAARSTDDGSLISRTWQPAVDRDGEYHVDRQQLAIDPAGIGSQAQIDLGKQLNPQAYPNRRVGHRISRWRDRVYQRRTWSVEFRPIVTPNAYTAPALSQLDARSKYVSPYGDAVATNVRVVNTTAPQMRRTPGPWDESITVDGTAGSPYAEPGFSSVWGL